MPDPATDTTAVLGAGAMGEAIVAGLIAAGRAPGSVLVAERRLERGHELAERYGVTVLENIDAAVRADIVLVAVKPQDVGSVLDEVGDVLQPGVVVVSVAAGATTAALESRLPAGTAVVRVMPNTPALVSEGMSVLSPGSSCTPEQLDRARALMSAVGKVAEVAEPYQDAVTAVSGSGPAYVFHLAESLIDAGVLAGLPRPLATELTVQTLYGAASMLRAGQHPTLLREQVTSPGGTTAAALAVLDDRAVKAAYLQAVEAARDRSRTLS